MQIKLGVQLLKPLDLLNLWKFPEISEADEKKALRRNEVEVSFSFKKM